MAWEEERKQLPEKRGKRSFADRLCMTECSMQVTSRELHHSLIVTLLFKKPVTAQFTCEETDVPQR